MKRRLVCRVGMLLLLCLGLGNSSARFVQAEGDLETAQELSRSTGKPLLVVAGTEM